MGLLQGVEHQSNSAMAQEAKEVLEDTCLKGKGVPGRHLGCSFANMALGIQGHAPFGATD